MSGGAFDYLQYRIHDIVERIEEEISHNTEKPEYWWGGEWKGQVYTDDTIAEFKKGVELLMKAEVYAQRIDWLISGDDGEESFHERLKEDLEKADKEFSEINWYEKREYDDDY